MHIYSSNTSPLIFDNDNFTSWLIPDHVVQAISIKKIKWKRLYDTQSQWKISLDILIWVVSIQSAAFKYFESSHRALREGLRGLRVGSTRCNWVTLPLQYVSVACCSAPTLISVTLARSHLDQSHNDYRNVLLISIHHYVVERKSSLVLLSKSVCIAARTAWVEQSISSKVWC